MLKYFLLPALLIALAGCSEEKPEAQSKSTQTAVKKVPVMEQLKDHYGAYYRSSKRSMHLFRITPDGFDYKIYYSRDLVNEKNAKMRSIPVNIRLIEDASRTEWSPRLTFKVQPTSSTWDATWNNGGEFFIAHVQNNLFESAVNHEFFGEFAAYPHKIYEDGTPSQLIRVGL